MSAMDTIPDWALDQPLRCRDGVELITGAGGRSMLVTPEGRFVHLSPAAVLVTQALSDGPTGRALWGRFVADEPSRAAAYSRSLPHLLTTLRQVGALEVEPAEPTRRERVTALVGRDPVKRFPLTQDPARLVAPVTRLAQAVAARTSPAWLLVLPAAAAFGAFWTLTHSAPALLRPGALLGLAFTLLIVQILLHECAHAVAMAMLGLTPRNAGLGLMFFVIPMAYVDRTECYRHPGRLGRALVSLAGPFLDMLCITGVAIGGWLTTGTVHSFLYSFLVLQCVSLTANLNPLFPSDGYHALEAALGGINMRSRAVSYLGHLVARTPEPPHLAGQPRRVRAGYLAYLFTSSAYVVLVLGLVVHNTVRILEGRHS
jgi:putative peptide zinc metalloprotease protein